MNELTFGCCKDCKFKREIGYGHWKYQYYKYFCLRFPPKPSTDPQDIWSEYSSVGDKDGCWEFKSEG